MRRTFISLTLVMVLTLVALPVAAAPDGGPVMQMSLIVAKVADAVSDLWTTFVAPDVGGRASAPLDGIGADAEPNG